MTTTFVPEIGRCNVIFEPRNDERYLREPFDDFLAYARSVKTLQQFLQNQAGGDYLLMCYRVVEKSDRGMIRWNISPHDE